MDKHIKYIQIAFFCTFLFCLSIVGFNTIQNHRKTSSLEGRKLALFPSVESFTKDPTKAIQQVNDAFSDQLTFRNTIIQAYNQLTIFGLHQTYAKDVVVGKHNELYQAPSFIMNEAEYKKRLKNCANMINSQAKPIMDMGIPFIFISYPQKDVVMRNDLPWYYPDTQKVYMESMDYMKSLLLPDIYVIDALDLFKDQAQKKLYYTLDHHTNIQGQQLVYEQIVQRMREDFTKLTPYTLDDYQVENAVVEGAFNRKIGNILQAEPEPLYLTPKTFSYTYQRYDEGKASKASLMKKNGAYSAYMSGDFAETRIVRDVQDMPKVFISGSSFSNALEYLLIPNVRELLSIDYRHNTSGLQLNEYVAKELPDYVIFIPSQSTGSFLDYMYKQHLGLSETSQSE